MRVEANLTISLESILLEAAPDYGSEYALRICKTYHGKVLETV